MITTTKKIAERAQNDPNFKNEVCIVFPADRYGDDPRFLIDIVRDLTAAMCILPNADGFDDDMMCSLHECICEMSINSEQTRIENGKVIVEL